MFNPKVLPQPQTPHQPRERFRGMPNLWLMGLVAVAAVGAGAMFAGRDRLHFQAGCGSACENQPDDHQRTFLSAGLKSNSEPGQVYALQFVRRHWSSTEVAANSKTAGGDTTPSELTASVAASSDPFRDAVNAAIKAANLTQTAQSPQEWVTVGQHWQLAIANMQAVSPKHERYELAQQKAQEYGSNLNYAKQNAGSAWTDGQTGTAIANASKQEQSTQGQAPLSPTESGSDASKPGQSVPSKFLMMLLVGGGLTLVLCLEPLRFFRKDEEIGSAKSPQLNSLPKAKKLKEPIPWGLMMSNWAHDIWDMQPFFKSERVYKMTAATSAHKLQRKLYRRLMSLTGDQAVALQLIKENLKRHPGQSANWCCEQAIRELNKQRQREHLLKQSSEIQAKSFSEQPFSERPLAESPLSDPALSETPFSEPPPSEQPFSEPPFSEQALSELPFSEQSFSEQSFSEQSFADETLLEESSAGSQLDFKVGTGNG